MNRAIATLVIMVVFLAGCAESTESFQGQIEDIRASSFIVDCSDEVNKGKKDGINAIGYGCSVEYTSNTTLKNASGKLLTVNDFLPGAEVKVILSKPVNIRRNIENNNPKSLTAMEIILVKSVNVSSIEPFDFKRNEVIKVTIYLGDTDEVIAEIEESEALNEFSAILQNAPSPSSGLAPADLPNTIVIESSDGSERKLEVTGNGSIFIDQTSKNAYSLDKEKFNEFVRRYKNNRV